MRASALPKVLLSPSVLLVLVCVYGYIMFTIYLSFTSSLMMPTYDWVGTASYRRLFGLQNWEVSVSNLLVFASLYIVLAIALGLLFAILIDQRIRAEGVARSIFLYPMALSFIVTGVVWRWLMNPSTGLNRLFDAAGLGMLESGWYTDPGVGIKAIAVAAVWQLSGYAMALYLAGLRAIPRELYEAAAVDGAGAVQAFWRITLPLLTPITLSAVIVLGHISLKIFDLVIAIAGPQGGPAFSSDVPANFMFQTTFQANRFADGAAVSMVLLLVVSSLVIPYLYWSLRREVRR